MVLDQRPGRRRTRRGSSRRPRHETPQVTLSFSELKYLFECPYQFKLRFLYGFNPPIHEALGYGKGLHDALAEVHKRALDGDLVDHRRGRGPRRPPPAHPVRVPRAAQTLRRGRDQGGRALPRRARRRPRAARFTARSRSRSTSRPGITVDGRIDLVRRLDTDELAIVDFKSTARAQDEDVTRDQLHVYAVGYQELTGERADLIEVLNLDEEGKTIREQVEDPLLSACVGRSATPATRCGRTTFRGCRMGRQCTKCDLAELCRDVPALDKAARRAASGR